MNNYKTEKLDTIRMKNIISQLTDVIYLLCDAKGSDMNTVLNLFTNLTSEEQEHLNLSFSHELRLR